MLPPCFFFSVLSLRTLRLSGEFFLPSASPRLCVKYSPTPTQNTRSTVKYVPPTSTPPATHRHRIRRHDPLQRPHLRHLQRPRSRLPARHPNRRHLSLPQGPVQRHPQRPTL